MHSLSGLTCPVLVMSYIPAAAINIAASHNITATVYDEGLADMYKAELLPCNKLTVHVKVCAPTRAYAYACAYAWA